MSAKVFKGNFTQQEPIPEAAIERAVAVMRSGRLHRYNVAEGEISETVLLEQQFSEYMGGGYCLAVTSGGYALTTALRAYGVKPGEPVLTNAFTLSPVPGAIQGAGGRPILVEVTDDLVIDLADLERKIASTKSRVLMLSHMRGHIVDMDALMRIADRHGVAVIEDCAHTMGGFLARHEKRPARPRRLLQHADLQARELGRGRFHHLTRCRADGTGDDPLRLLHAL